MLSPWRKSSQQTWKKKKKKNIFEFATPLQIGVTPLLIEYVANLCHYPETWTSFPVEEALQQKMEKSTRQNSPPQASLLCSEEDYPLTDKQEAHVKAALNHIPELHRLRQSLVPRHLSNSLFWQIYFLLISNKFRLTDSDEGFRMPLRTDTSLRANAFYLAWEQQATSGSTSKPFSYLCDDATTFRPLDSSSEDSVCWWHAFPTGSRSPDYESTFIDPSHGTQGVTNWGPLVDPAVLKQDQPKVLKTLLREGVPDMYRHKAWRVCPSSSIGKELATRVGWRAGLLQRLRKPKATPEQSYREVLEEIFGKEVPASCHTILTFNGNTSFHQHHYLSEEGVAIARRLLMVVALTKPRLHSAPILPDLVALLVSFMAEDDAYETLSVLIDESIERCHYLPAGNRHTELFGLAFVRILEEHLPIIFKHLQELKLDSKKIFVQWISTFFVSELPYQTVLRLVDCALYEGTTVLYRVALALFSRAEDAILTCSSQKELESALTRQCALETVADPLLEVAWTYNIKHDHLMTIYDTLVLLESALDEVDEEEMEIFHLPSIKESSDIIGPQQFETLWRWIPHRYRLRSLTRIFHSNVDGFNLATLIDCCQDSVPTILLIKTSNQKRFGVFLEQPWQVQDRYYGSGESFLFSFSNREQLFKWQRDANQCFMRLGRDQVAFGGGNCGDGLRLDEELWRGQSYRCATYDNDPLHGDASDPEFECATLEVYGFL